MYQRYPPEPPSRRWLMLLAVASVLAFAAGVRAIT